MRFESSPLGIKFEGACSLLVEFACEGGDMRCLRFGLLLFSLLISIAIWAQQTASPQVTAPQPIRDPQAVNVVAQTLILADMLHARELFLATKRVRLLFKQVPSPLSWTEPLT
jgi:hypothetical protein